MAVKEWVDVAQVAGVIIAACGLLFTGVQVRRGRHTAELQALQTFSEDAREREGALAKATTEEERLHAFYEFLNFLELYACAYNNGLIIGRGGREIVRHKLEDSYIELDAAQEWHPHIAKALDRSTTFAELTKFVGRNNKELGQRKAERKRAALGTPAAG